MKPKDSNKEQAIRKQAIEMIVKVGFDGLSMHKLAKAANLSASTIYIYFENREDLLNQLFIQVEQNFEDATLKDFSPEMPFEVGLWLQWINRYHHIIENPVEFQFYEQFRTSPLVKRKPVTESKFRKTMAQFVENAMSSGQIVQLRSEIFWSIAYGAFYTLIKFHLDQSTMAGTPFNLNEQTLRNAFGLVLKSLKH